MAQPDLISAYNILNLIYPEANINQISETLHSKKGELEKLGIDIPSIQATAFGAYCKDLAEYRGRLMIAVGEGEPRKKYLSEEISKVLYSNPQRTCQLCAILGTNPASI